MKSAAAFVLVASFMVACGSSPAPTAPSAPARRSEQITYAINVPSVVFLEQLRAQFPNGFAQPPLVAQHAFDYTEAYHGSPNVYLPPGTSSTSYHGVGILIAPLNVAGMTTFTAADWPDSGLQPNTDYSWIGQFDYASAGN
ncbi:MAG TPA: hypothetical protein VEU08_17235 [Vicinamibacterales bacterium]|nr:hypothetical protein [Vicinamibacterales bacterium]